MRFQWVYTIIVDGSSERHDASLQWGKASRPRQLTVENMGKMFAGYLVSRPLPVLLSHHLEPATHASQTTS